MKSRASPGFWSLALWKPLNHEVKASNPPDGELFKLLLLLSIRSVKRVGGDALAPRSGRIVERVWSAGNCASLRCRTPLSARGASVQRATPGGDGMDAVPRQRHWSATPNLPRCEPANHVRESGFRRGPEILCRTKLQSRASPGSRPLRVPASGSVAKRPRSGQEEIAPGFSRNGVNFRRGVVLLAFSDSPLDERVA